MPELPEVEKKPILFCDFDGTICRDRFWRSEPPDIYEKIQNYLFGSNNTIINDWLRGEYSAEYINHKISEKVEIPYDELWNLFVRDCKTMKVDINILEKLSALRSIYITILITGNMDSFSRFTVPALNLQQYFDHISNSYYEKKLKTDNNGEIFLEYCNKFNSDITTSVLIDDSPKVCQVFTGLGGKAFQITSEKDIHYYFESL